MKRVILIVMDSLGVGALPDAEKYGDKGADTLGHILDNTENFEIPNLQRLGFGNIKAAAGGRLALANPKGAYGRLKEMSIGKDTITGHWEIAGIETTTPFKTYPKGLPEDFIVAFEKAIGTKVIGNYAASGTVIIETLGDEHESTGYPIVYTSADSVFQIAANTDVIPLETLYDICQKARTLLVGKWACGRVIARPYAKVNGKRERTSDRHDYAVSPPENTILNYICESGKEVAAVGKINDIFNGSGITKTVHTENNMDGVDKTIEYMKENFEGLIFTNLVDFDSKFGHRRDPQGYGKAIMEFDQRLPSIMEAMNDEDILMICADHGNDPAHSGFDHTREYIPLVVFGRGIEGVEIDDRSTFADIGETIAEILQVRGTHKGKSFLSIIKGE